MIAAAPQRDVQAVEGVEADVGDDEIGVDRIEQPLCLLQRRRRGDQVAALRQEHIGAVADRGIGADQQDQSRHVLS